MRKFEFRLEESDRPFLTLLKVNHFDQWNVLMEVHSELEGIDQLNMPYDVVADNLKIPLNTVKSRLNRARYKIINWRKGVKADGTIQGVQGIKNTLVG